MSNVSDTPGQDEIEQLLSQAAGPTPNRAASSPAATGPQPEMQAPNSDASDMDEDVQELLEQAEAAIRSVNEPVESQVPGLAPFTLRDLTSSPPAKERASLDLLRDVELDLRIELGRTHMYLEDVLRLRNGSVVPLDKLAGDPVDVFVNGRLVARGEVLVLNENFCVRIAELVAGTEGD
jgi:flagellar motor switch protein FliN